MLLHGSQEDTFLTQKTI